LKTEPSLENGQDKTEDIWLVRARNAFDMSKSYFDTNHQQDIDDAIKMFNNEHPTGSKYNRPSFKYRSRIFRPKTRSSIRKNEAAGTAAFFSGIDSFDVAPLDENNDEASMAADVMKEIISYRLNNTIPWFQTCIGGLQDAQKTGVVCSYNFWDYKEIRTTNKEPLLDADGQQEIVDGEPQFTETEDVEVLRDKPVIKLIPVDQLRFHPAADWTDPINTSPFLIRQIPHYLQDVESKMRIPNQKTGEPKWKKYTRAEILQSKIEEFDSTRNAVNKGKQDAHSRTVADNPEYTMVWVHENIISHKGKDYVYYTLGTRHILTKPVPIDEVYWTGDRPYTMGCVILETHTTIPTGVAQLGRPLQEEVNDVANSRLDNVKLVLNKRYIAKRGAQVDLKSLTRNVAGSVTLADDINEVKAFEFQDVTSSSYAEQDRLNLDFDELVGAFSQSSVQSNRRMNETVGGLNMVQSSAGQMTDYLLRTFAETWLEPTLRQLVKLEAKYETDEVVLTVAMNKAKLMPRYGKTPKIDDLLNKELLVKVDVGLGASNPQYRLERFLFGITKFTEIARSAPKELDLAAISRELFGYLGYKSGDRFLTFDEQNQDPKYQQLMQVIEELQGALDKATLESKQKMELEAFKQKNENDRHDDSIRADLIMEDMKQDNKESADKLQLALKLFQDDENERRAARPINPPSPDQPSNGGNPVPQL